MKALTLWQPWASLIAWGEKEYETRSWSTDYRGLLAIHAAKNHNETISMIMVNSFYRDVFNCRPLTQPQGAVLCVVDLIDVIHITRERKDIQDLGITQKEQCFGDWSEGRYAWKFANVRVLVDPIDAKGMQQLWEWPVSLGALEFK